MIVAPEITLAPVNKPTAVVTGSNVNELGSPLRFSQGGKFGFGCRDGEQTDGRQEWKCQGHAVAPTSQVQTDP